MMDDGCCGKMEKDMRTGVAETERSGKLVSILAALLLFGNEISGSKDTDRRHFL